ncbi:hypothetical protein FOJ82_13455 [Tessaracoccus rhinocerotis]|uniref:Uncharacterized protein n=1 Tax=Tessaracoccus rhinocerotis TaxID=1689449 RepID=A0A553JWR1_9ACTN|nr:hypothetical protein [Tessaracoccus rhinocerotis]TRY16874.1 hypothetical protein FOJ82_13455 [Tessaracoccus rhinocerotis]
MSFFSRLRSLFRGQPAPATPRPLDRTLPPPTRIALSDVEEDSEHFSHIKDWATLSPGDPAWELPEIGQQFAWISERIQGHADSGGLDGLVPDLMDREIHHEMAELRDKIRSADVQCHKVEARLFEQAKLAQSQVAGKVSQARSDLQTAYAAYTATYETLTGRRPVLPEVPLTVRPILINTEKADFPFGVDDWENLLDGPAGEIPDPPHETPDNVRSMNFNSHEPHEGELP